MNILFLNTSTVNPVFGGIQSVSYYLSKYFEKRGNHVVMLAWKKVTEMSDLDYAYMPYADNILHKDNISFLQGLIRERNITLIINHTCLSPNHSLILKYIQKENVKIISIFHNPPFGMYGIHKYRWLSISNNEILKKIANVVLLYLFRIKYGRKFRIMAKNSDKIVMLSDKFIPELIYFIGKKYIDKMTAIPNPVTIKDMPRCKKENVILFVGRLSPEKGLPFLLEIWRQIEGTYPNWELQIVGDGKERSFVERQINKLHLEHCKLFGFQRPELFYNRAKIFCMTSLFEGFGLVLVEAMHYGVVPFAFNSYPNVSEIIEEGKSGFIIPAFDTKTYANKITWLIDHPSILSKMSANSINNSEEFSIERIGDKWEKLIASLIQQG